MKHGIVLLIIAISVVASWAQTSHEAAKERMVVVEAQLKEQRDLALADATAQYTAVLEKRMALLQQQGSLDGVIALRELRQLVETDARVSDAPCTVDAAVEKARQDFLRVRNATDAKHLQALTKLVSQYLNVQEGMIKRLVQEGKLDDAVALKAEAEQTRTRLASLREQLPKPGSQPGPRVGVFPRSGTKFIRLHIDEAFSDREVQLAEVEFLQAGEKISVKLTGFSSEYNESSWAAKRVIDGDVRGGWANADAQDGEFPQWFQFEHAEGKAFKLSQVRIHTGASGAGNYRLKSFTVYISNDGKNWRQCTKGTLDEDKEDGWEQFGTVLARRSLRFE